MRRKSRRGKIGRPHADPDDPPRGRATKQRGHGPFDNDRPPVLGVVGRDAGRLRLEVDTNSTRDVLLPRVLACAPVGTTAYADEWSAHARHPDFARPHATVCHNPQRPGGPEFARDVEGGNATPGRIACRALRVARPRSEFWFRASGLPPWRPGKKSG